MENTSPPCVHVKTLHRLIYWSTLPHKQKLETQSDNHGYVSRYTRYRPSLITRTGSRRCRCDSLIPRGHHPPVGNSTSVRSDPVRAMSVFLCSCLSSTLSGRSQPTSRNDDVVITPKRHHFDVITSKWRRFDVITTLLYIKSIVRWNVVEIYSQGRQEH